MLIDIILEFLFEIIISLFMMMFRKTIKNISNVKTKVKSIYKPPLIYKKPYRTIVEKDLINIPERYMLASVYNVGEILKGLWQSKGLDHMSVNEDRISKISVCLRKQGYAIRFSFVDYTTEEEVIELFEESCMKLFESIPSKIDSGYLKASKTPSISAGFDIGFPINPYGKRPEFGTILEKR